MAINSFTGTYLGEGTNTGSIFSAISQQTKISDEENHKKYLADMAKKRELIQQQKIKAPDKQTKANLDIQLKTSLLGDYFKDKAYQVGKDRYSETDEGIVQKQMKNIKSFPNAETEIMSYMNGGIDDKTLFKSLDSQYAKSNYVPKLASTLRNAGFSGNDDMEVINNYIEKSGDKKAKQDLIDIGVLDEPSNLLDNMSHPGTSLINYAQTIKNPIVSGVLQTVGQLVQGGERAFGGIIGEEEKLLQKAGLKQSIPKQNLGAKKPLVQNAADVALGTAETALTAKFPGMTTLFNVASKTPYIKNVTDALGRLANKIGTPLEYIPGFDELEPKQQEELKSYLGGFVLGKGYSKIVKRQSLSQTALQKETSIQEAPGKFYEKLATKNPIFAKVIGFIESKIAPETSIGIQKKRAGKIQQQQEGITSTILQPGEKTQKAPEATTKVFKTEKGKADFPILKTQTNLALSNKGKELDSELSKGDKQYTPKPEQKITEIATILKRKMSGDKTLKGTSEYENNLTEIDTLLDKSKTIGLGVLEKQKLKRMLDSEVENLYDDKGGLKTDAITKKTLTSYRDLLKTDIEKSSGNPDKVRKINEEYNSLRQSNTLLDRINRKLKSSTEAPGYIQETLSKFVVLNWMRKRGVKDIGFLNRELSKLVGKLESKQLTKEAIENNINKTIKSLESKTP